ncbi:PP2C family protein-serine/threonine phosphatase [Paenibacillus ginsengarvi]|uniref:Serine/threonine-protein phosphatase n=1 Tax=Paenibacillus ginsengarvi TaxID=400777 RepID=A0A3B0BZ06_9BACL|nr:PP2C family protein-serine/threonine phosphatase [Paenibacillus ginsengarvi]RKN78915.1 serine/threonine-protein phosphatase [Paenibacillus ginsengarvi]
MAKLKTSYLPLRLFAVFFLSMLVGCGLLVYSNLVILGFSFGELLAFQIPVVVSASCVMAVLLSYITGLRLRPVMRAMGSERPDDKQVASVRLWRLPNELFWWMLGLTCIGIVLYHADEYALLLRSSAGSGEPAWTHLLQRNLNELTIGLAISLLFLIWLQRTVKRYLVLLHPTSLPPEKNGTFWKPLVLTYVCCFAIVIYPTVRFLLGEEAGHIRFGWLAITLAVHGFLAFTVYRLLTKQFRDELRNLISGISVLLQGKRTRLHETVPVISDDEVGRLASVFNELQKAIAAKYEAVEREMALASEMQLGLLPESYVVCGHYTVASRFKPAKEVGGDLYDIVRLGDSQTIVLVGDVSGKGMPAALLMSATLALFRSQLQAGGTAADIIRRMNRDLSGMLRGDMYVTLGLALFDADSRTVRYASAGHVAPFRIGAEGAELVPVGSLPAGFDPDEAYEETVMPFHPGDRLVLYTDGIVESLDESMHMLGFERFEALLDGIDRTDPVQRQLDRLLGLLPEESSPDRDDRTLLLISMQD